MSRSMSVTLAVAVGAVAVWITLALGLWWFGWIIGAVLGLVIRPRLAGLAVLLGWLGADVIGAIHAHLIGASRVIAEIAGFPGALGLVLLALGLLLAYAEGAIPALLVRWLRGEPSLSERPVQLGSHQNHEEAQEQPQQ
jgi:hypothetical protein